MVPCGKMLLNKYGMVTFIQVQGQSHGQRLKKKWLPFFLEIDKATDVKFATMVPCGKWLQNKHGVVTFTQGQGKQD